MKTHWREQRNLLFRASNCGVVPQAQTLTKHSTATATSPPAARTTDFVQEHLKGPIHTALQTRRYAS